MAGIGCVRTLLNELCLIHCMYRSNCLLHTNRHTHTSEAQETMIRATRGMWRSPRQLLRASKAKNGSATGGGKQRSMCDLTKQESTIGGQQRHAFGRATMDAVRVARGWSRT